MACCRARRRGSISASVARRGSLSFPSPCRCVYAPGSRVCPVRPHAVPWPPAGGRGRASARRAIMGGHFLASVLRGYGGGRCAGCRRARVRMGSCLGPGGMTAGSFLGGSLASGWRAGALVGARSSASALPPIMGGHPSCPRQVSPRSSRRLWRQRARARSSSSSSSSTGSSASAMGLFPCRRGRGLAPSSVHASASGVCFSRLPLRACMRAYAGISSEATGVSAPPRSGVLAVPGQGLLSGARVVFRHPRRSCGGCSSCSPMSPF